MTGVQPDEWLPTIQELTVPELKLSSPVLKAGAHHFGKFCDYQSKVRPECSLLLIVIICIINGSSNEFIIFSCDIVAGVHVVHVRRKGSEKVYKGGSRSYHLRI